MPDSSSNTIEIIARGLSYRDGRILVCRNVEYGYCYLPGGHVEFGEAAEQACEREYLEETGLVVQSGECCIVAEVCFTQEGASRHEINIVFHVEQSVGGLLPEQIPSLEPELQFEWVAVIELEISGFQPRNLLGPLSAIARQTITDPDSIRSSGPIWVSDEG